MDAPMSLGGAPALCERPRVAESDWRLSGRGENTRPKRLAAQPRNGSPPKIDVVLAEGRTETHCPYCSLQCGMELVEAGGTLEVRPRDFPTNRGGLCKKGWTSAELLGTTDRLTTPLMRDKRGEPLRQATWDEAIARVGSAFRDTQARHGPDAVGVFGGGGLTNEKAYALGKFARVVLRTKHIDYNGRFCMASAAVAGQRAFGIDRGLPFPLTDIPGAKVIALVGANPAETMPPVMQFFEEQRANGGKLIVIDPRRTPTADAASLHLQLSPGTDAALANGLLHVAIREALIDRDFIAERTTGFEAVRHLVASCWPDRTERITGVPADRIVLAARLLGGAGRAMILTARGAEQQSRGVQNALAFVNLALALGLVGKPSSGFGCLTGQGNGQGGREHGQKSDQLPGYRRIDNPAHRAHVAGVWGIPVDELPGPGVSACEMFDALGRDGGVRALLVMGSNLVVSAPNASHLEAQLAALDCLVVADPFLSETAAIADVVLPSCQWAEEEGTMTNLEGRLLYRRAARPPPDGVRSDLTILKQLATAFGRERHLSETPEDVFNELRRASAGGVADYSGFSYARLRSGESLFWPCPAEAHPGTPRLFADTFPTSDGRARFHAVEHEPPSEEPNEEFPLYLTTGRVMSHYQSGTQTRRVPVLRDAEPEPFVEMHPGTAGQYGLAVGAMARVRTRRGTALLRVRTNPSMRLDTLFVPFHWAGRGRANTLTTDALDPDSKIPAFKVAAATLEKPQENAHD
jgi:assimilatory nitrate reductase catalytic subunit